ncbi:TauD/TfdA dioxygenase family protein [Acidisoma silvae]|uniref:TauD/TfdA family dioxygenase n=1 Tax=Acidisoma silvae TaxID=2802396 RepID=A0A963YVJ0_9PROT|nr:TauD/TfdA family dioxygenase [Acidisoma silvae]MCB8877987.1 TauD/TfdA family dioxygenase [Acidisoma silvae]
MTSITQAPDADFRITPIIGSLAAEVRGVDSRGSVRPAQILAVKAALKEHLVLVFKDQQPEDDDFLRFTSYFGAVFTPPRNSPVLGGNASGQVPDIVLVSNVDEGVLGNRELTAHSDHHWTPVPSSGSLLYAIEVSKNGGDTTFHNLAAAYDALDDGTKREIDQLQLITYNPFLRATKKLPGSSALYRTPDIEQLTPFEVHPLVRTHPESGRRLIYLGEATEVEIVNYDPAAGAALIARLRAHILEPRFRYAHRWTRGDIVYWDNQITLHGRSAFDPNERRVMKRISLAGSRPF